MDVNDLENHLVELEAKEMETRGVLRRLIIEYCRLGNSKRITELMEKFSNCGYKESAGIKGVMLQTYIQNGHLNEALEVYDELILKHSQFAIDSHKIIDLGVLLVNNGKFEDAINIIEREGRTKLNFLCIINESFNKISIFRLIKGGKAIERNCWKLLTSIKEPKNVKIAFDLLVSLGYCKASNIILGPLVKVHLNKYD